MGRTAEELTADIRCALGRATAAFEALTSAGSPALANDAAWLLERRAEELTLLARSLPVWAPDPDRGHSAQPPDLSPFPVQIRQTAEGWLHLTLPALLPKKKQRARGPRLCRCRGGNAEMVFGTGAAPVYGLRFGLSPCL